MTTEKIQIPPHLVGSFQNSKMCQDCMIKYHQFYKNNLIQQPWPLFCRGDLRLHPKPANDDEEKLQLLEDPVAWAEYEFEDPNDPGKPMMYRCYQKDMVSCSSRFQCVRAGRRIGKCLAPETKIHLADGSYIPIEQLDGQFPDVISFNGSAFVNRKAAVIKNVIKPCVKVTFKSKRSIRASTDHPFRVFKGWREASKLRPGDRVASERHGRFGQESMPDEEVEFLALIIGDGGLTENVVKFTNTKQVLVGRMRELAEYFSCYLKQLHHPIDYAIRRNEGEKLNGAAQFLRAHGLMNHGARTKFVPDCIFRLTERQVSLFLNRLFSTDGWACLSSCGGEVGYCSTSYRLIMDVHRLLMKFGIVPSIQYKKGVDAWSIFIHEGNAIRVFSERIGIFAKDGALKSAVENASDPAPGKSYIDCLPPEIWDDVKTLLDGRVVSKILGNGRIRSVSAPSRDKIRALATIFESDELRKHADADLLWDIVESVEPAGDLQTFDLSILNAEKEDDHNFVAEGLVVHNTHAEVIKFLHRMFLNRTRVMILTPSEAQITEIFQTIDLLIGGSKMMKEMVRTRTKNPDLLKLSNGSMVRGFVINSAAGTKSDKVRGQPADIIYVDEMDYIPDSDFKAVTAIIMDKKNTELWATTTPSGLKSKFYFLCTDKNFGYKEFHYPAMVSPNWNPEVERYMRQQYNETEYVHEILAEFGDVEGGWYPRAAIDQSLRPYVFRDCVRREGCIYAIGLDWNEAPVGLQGCVVEYDPGHNMLTLVDKFNMSESEFTQLKSIEKVVEVNQKWRPHLIWADAGFGTTQIETLKRYAMEHPSLGMLSKIRGLNMGATEEIRDPWNGEIKKKRMKALISDVTLRQLEMQRCALPMAEDQKNLLVDQMRSYRVDHYNQMGDPIFAKGIDHSLTSWQIGIYAIVVTYSNLNKVTTVDMIMTAPSFANAKNKAPDFQYTGSLKLPKKVTDEMRKDAIQKQRHPRSIDPIERISVAGPHRDGIGRRAFEGGRSSFDTPRKRAF